VGDYSIDLVFVRVLYHRSILSGSKSSGCKAMGGYILEMSSSCIARDCTLTHTNPDKHATNKHAHSHMHAGIHTSHTHTPAHTHTYTCV